MNRTLDQIGLADIYRKFHPTAYTFFSNAHGILQDKSYTGHKTSLNKFKKTEIIQSIFSDHKRMKLETSKRKAENL